MCLKETRELQESIWSSKELSITSWEKAKTIKSSMFLCPKTRLKNFCPKLIRQTEKGLQ